MKFSRKNTQPLFLVGVLVGTFLLWLALIFFTSRWSESFQAFNLMDRTWIAVPSQTPEGIETLQHAILEGGCEPQNSACADWRKLDSLDFTRIPGRPRTFFLVTHVEGTTFSRPLRGEEPPLAQDRWVLSLGEGNGAFQVWAENRWLGKSSRFLAPKDKFYPFATTEAFPVPNAVIPAPATSLRLTVRVEPTDNPYLHSRLGISQLAVYERSQFLKIESLKLLSLTVAILSTLILGVYHFFVWLKRRDKTYLGFVGLSFFAGMQAVSYYNLLAYLEVDPEIIVRMRTAFLNTSFVNYVAFCLFAGVPVSYTFEWIKAKARKQGEKTAFEAFGPIKKSLCAFGEFLLYVVFPTLFFLLPSINVNDAMFIMMRVTAPLVIVTNYGMFVAMTLWFVSESKKRHMGYAIALAMGVAITQSAATASAIAALGSRHFSPMAVGYAVPFTLVLFAISLGDLFTLTHRRMGRLKAQLEDILMGTRELSVIREQGAAVALATHSIAERLEFHKGTNAYFLQSQEGEKGGQAVPAVQIMKDGAILLPPVPLAPGTRAPAPSALADDDTEAHVTSGGELVIPLRSADRCRGHLLIEGYRAEELSEDDSHFATALASSLAIALDNIRFLSETREMARLEAELGAAKAVQGALLPASTDFPGVDFATFYEPAAQTGGDWFGFWYDKASHNLDIYIGDVTGHGIPSALLTGVVCGAVYASEQTADTLASQRHLSATERLALIAEAANKVVKQTGRERLLMTMFFLTLNLETGELSYLNAGHNPPWRIFRKGDLAQTKALVSSGSRLGYTETPHFEQRTVRLEPGDKIFLYTDGLLENQGTSGKTLSDKALRTMLGEVSGESNQEILERIATKYFAILGENTPADDVAMFLFGWNGPLSREDVVTWKASSGTPGTR